MIFLGDIAVPKGVHPMIGDWGSIFANALTVANLEGALATNAETPHKRFSLYNDLQVLKYLELLNVGVVSLANNHLMDLGVTPDRTISRLRSHDILACGAGNDETAAARPSVVQDGNRVRLFLGFGWEPIGCQAADTRQPGINPLRPQCVLNSVREARRSDPNATIIVLMHWNYELELYPQPMHRQLAFAAVDAGADAVIGGHPHCVGGIEIYNGRPIVYSLGNWFLPQGDVFGMDLHYPSISYRQLAFEWVPEDGSMVCHWFQYAPDSHAISHVKSESRADSEWIRERTPFFGLPHFEYTRWFVSNRVRRLALPIYADCDHASRNRAKDACLCTRQALINLLVRLGYAGRRIQFESPFDHASGDVRLIR